MNAAVSRFIAHTLKEFVLKEYTSEEVIRNLKNDIGKLSEYLMNNEPDTPTFREKAKLLREKKEELEEILKENPQHKL